MLRSGFFNSQNHDRMYNATDFNELISTIKSDGIDNYGDKLEVSAGQGLSVQVSTGKCFFNNRWLYNDNAYQIELEEASIVAPRIDAIVVEVNDTERDVFLKSVSGEPSNNPAPPTLVDSGSVHQHLLAYVNVPKEATSVGTITDKRSEWSDVKSDKLDDVQDQITRNIENEEVASRTYNPGEYIVRNGVYYKVTQTIASGSAITEGVNIVSVTIGEEMTPKNRSSEITLKNYGGERYLHQVGNIVYLRMTVTAGVNGFVNFADIPTDVTPIVDIPCSFYALSATDANKITGVVIGHNGKIEIRASSATTNVVYISACWIL